MVRDRRAFLAGVGSVAVAGLAGCSGQTNSDDSTSTDAGTEAGTETETGESGAVEGEVTGNDTPLEIVEQNYFERASVVGVVGTVKNTGESTYSPVTVHFSPYEDEESRGKFYATSDAQNVDQLGPGETWEFAVALGESEIEAFNRYEVWVTGKKQG
jgi:hypothetical protein